MKINSNKVSYQYLESIPIKDKAYFITLTDYKGLRIKVNPSGRISFVTYARIKGGGNPRTITHGSKEKLSLPTAIDLHLQTIDLLDKGIDPNLLKKTKREQFNSSMKFIDIANEYLLKKKASGEHSINHFAHNLNYLLSNKLKSFHNDTIESITLDKIEQWWRNNSHTPAASKNALMLLSKIFKHASSTGLYYLQNNPANEFRRKMVITGQKTSKKQLDIVSEYPEYLYNLCDPMDEHRLNIITRNVIYMMTITGLKKNDILQLKAKQITDNSHITIKKRNKFIQVVPITNDIQSVLNHTYEYLHGNTGIYQSEYVFYNPKTGKPITNLRKSLVKLSSTIEWEVHPESIRKSFANICDNVSIPRKHYYQLLGIRECYIPHTDSSLENEQIDSLRLSLIKVQDKINGMCPMIVPGKYDRISDLIFM